MRVCVCVSVDCVCVYVCVCSNACLCVCVRVCVLVCVSSRAACDELPAVFTATVFASSSSTSSSAPRPCLCVQSGNVDHRGLIQRCRAYLTDRLLSAFVSSFFDGRNLSNNLGDPGSEVSARCPDKTPLPLRRWWWWWWVLVLEEGGGWEYDVWTGKVHGEFGRVLAIKL